MVTHASVQTDARLGYQAFLDFKRVKEALNCDVKKLMSNYSYDGNIYSRVITSARAVSNLREDRRIVNGMMILKL